MSVILQGNSYIYFCCCQEYNLIGASDYETFLTGVPHPRCQNHMPTFAVTTTMVNKRFPSWIWMSDTMTRPITSHHQVRIPQTTETAASSHDSGQAFAWLRKRWQTPIHSFEWMCMALWYQGWLIWRLLYKSLPQAIWHINCLYSLRNSNLSGYLWLSKLMYQI